MAGVDAQIQWLPAKGEHRYGKLCSTAAPCLLLQIHAGVVWKPLVLFSSGLFSLALL
jgi:hypothetical protein